MSLRHLIALAIAVLVLFGYSGRAEAAELPDNVREYVVGAPDFVKVPEPWARPKVRRGLQVAGYGARFGRIGSLSMLVGIGGLLISGTVGSNVGFTMSAVLLGGGLGMMAAGPLVTSFGSLYTELQLSRVGVRADPYAGFGALGLWTIAATAWGLFYLYNGVDFGIDPFLITAVIASSATTWLASRQLAISSDPYRAPSQIFVTPAIFPDQGAGVVATVRF